MGSSVRSPSVKARIANLDAEWTAPPGVKTSRPWTEPKFTMWPLCCLRKTGNTAATPQKRALDVEVNRRLPLDGVDLREADEHHAGGVDEDVDATEIGKDGFDQRLDLDLVDDIDLIGTRSSTVCRDLGRDGLGFGPIDVGNCDAGAMGGQVLRGCESNAACTAENEGDFGVDLTLIPVPLPLTGRGPA